MLLPSGNPFKYHEDVLYLQPMISPQRFDIFPPDCWGMLRRSRRVQLFLEKLVIVVALLLIHIFSVLSLQLKKL